MAETSKRYLDRVYEMTEATSGTEVRAAYDGWAASYDEEVAQENGYATPGRVAEAVAAVADLPRDARLLDIGCGTGLAGAALSAKGFTRIDGCDFSDGMLTVAGRTGVYGRLFEADLNAPPIDVETGAYDAAVAVGVFASAHLNAAAVDECLRCVKPGGVFCVTTNDHFYETGVLQGRLAALEAEGAVDMRLREHGAHLPARNVGGWVFLMLKR